MNSEFRRYDKVNCSFFDLIDGELEPRQTMALGYLLSQSGPALKAFLFISGIKIGKYDRCVVDCEAQKKSPGNNDRIDILLRFYSNYVPVGAVIIEAKSVSVTTSAYVAGGQGLSYASGFHQLSGFPSNLISVVTLTRTAAKDKSTQGFISITWSQLISEFFDLISPKTDPSHIIEYFVNYIINVKGSMNYYEKEILAIPAGKTFDAIMASGIYECPASGKYMHKKSLYLAFKAPRGGDMDKLYKLEDIYLLNINDPSAVTAIDHALPGFSNRIDLYKRLYENNGKNPYPVNENEVKQVYVLDTKNPIVLPVTVRPMENNATSAYYELQEFIGQPNSSLRKIVVQKNIWIDKNVLYINPGKKVYDLSSNGSLLKQFLGKNGNFLLNTANTYLVNVTATLKGTAIKSIELKYDNGKWKFFYNF